MQATEHEGHFKIKVSVFMPNAENEKRVQRFTLPCRLLKMDSYKFIVYLNSMFLCYLTTLNNTKTKKNSYVHFTDLKKMGCKVIDR